jgi:excisionase family DNA binding protein
MKRRTHTRDLARVLDRFKKAVRRSDTGSRPIPKKVSRGQIVHDWLPVVEAARLLGVTRRQVYELIKAKKLRAVPITWPSGYSVRWVTRASLERYARRRYA